MAAERFVIICSRVVDMTGLSAPGSRHARCEKCRAVVWLSAATERAAKKRGFQRPEVRCMHCIPTPPEGEEVERIVPREVIDEAVKATGDPEGVAWAVELITGKRPNDG